MTRIRLLLLPACLFCGCISGSVEPTTQPVTAVDAQTGDADYWLSQPAAATVTVPEFDPAWNAAEQTARSLFYAIDRTDRRGGVLSTEPTITSQFFEPWRGDAETPYETAESSLASIRRTIRFEFSKREDGAIDVAPKVLVERYSQAESRITSVVLYRSVFKIIRPTEGSLIPYGTRETDRGVYLPRRYWYAVGRDAALEQALADEIRRRVQS